jgi:hypothetical protein
LISNQRNEKTEYILKKIKTLHEENRSSEYLFLGSSGGFLHEIREKVLDKTDGIFNNNFKVINQYVVEEIKKNA